MKWLKEFFSDIKTNKAKKIGLGIVAALLIGGILLLSVYVKGCRDGQKKAEDDKKVEAVDDKVSSKPAKK